jgi:hypothetical protein
MTIGAAWHIDNPDKPEPWAWFDKDEVQDIPVTITDWLTDKGTTYSSHLVETDVDLECTNPTTGHTAGVIKMRIQKLAAGADLVNNRKYGVTLRLTGADGQVEDLTLFLKIRSK